jgi:chromosome segregation ATPase
MNKVQELEQVDRERKEIGTQVDKVQFHLRSLASNLALLNSIRQQLQDNIRVLKNPLYIALLSEYGKIKAELLAVENRLATMRVDFNNHVVALERTEKMLLLANEKYATLFRNQDAPVIRGEFGKK